MKSIPEVGSVWRHHKGPEYEVLMITNAESTRAEYPPTVVYRGVVNGKLWSRRLDDWNRSMTKVSSPAPEAELEKLGRFGHHPDPAIDYCIEVEAIEGYYFDATHGIGKPSEGPRKIDDTFRNRVEHALDFIVGGDLNAIAAKSIVRRVHAELATPTPAVDHLSPGGASSMTITDDTAAKLREAAEKARADAAEAAYRIEHDQVVAALRAIESMCPATQEMTLAHAMADLARDTLTDIGAE